MRHVKYLLFVGIGVVLGWVWFSRPPQAFVEEVREEAYVIEGTIDFGEVLGKASKADSLFIPEGISVDTFSFRREGCLWIMDRITHQNRGVEQAWKEVHYDFEKYVQTYLKAGTETVSLYTESLFESKRYVSYRMRYEIFQGGPHGYHGYLSFVYDKQAQKTWTFEDMFVLKDGAAAVAFMKLINLHMDTDKAEMKEFFPLYFNLEDQAISFNFNSYTLGEYALGCPRSEVPISELKPFLRHN